jgi:phosphatidate phosphatase APP1
MPRLVALALLLVAVPAAAIARDRPALLLPPGLGRPDVVWVSGRVLEEQYGKHGPKAVRSARVLAGSYLVGAEVEVTFLGRSAKAISGHDGEFEVELRPLAGESFPAGTSEATVRVEDVTGAARVEVMPPDAPFLLVSDFDDTVAVTNVTRTRDMLATTFLKDAETHPAVPGMAGFYRCLHAKGAPVAFVSGSPAQFAPRLARFLERNGFPSAALYLRNLGRKTLRGYKEPVLARLAERFPEASFVLVGDTGERDPEIYAAFASAHPGRVARVFLRQATAEPVPPARVAGAYLFREPAMAAREAVARGLADEGCVEGAFPGVASQGGSR